MSEPKASSALVATMIKTIEQLETFLADHLKIESGYVEMSDAFKNLFSQENAMERCLREAFPALNELVLCPEDSCFDDCESNDLFTLVQHLNDDHQWKREDIASWLEELDLDLKVST